MTVEGDRTGQTWEHVDAVFLVVGEPTRAAERPHQPWEDCDVMTRIA